MKKDEKGAAFVNSVVEIGTEPFFLILTTIFTVVAGVCVNFFADGTLMYTLCDRGFYISLSLILVQIMLQLFDIRHPKNIENDVMFPKFSDSQKVNSSMYDVLDDKKSDKHVRIICYGINGYGGLIEEIVAGHYRNITKLDMIVCSPDNPLLTINKNDSARIKDTLHRIYSYAKSHEELEVQLYCSNIPPTIRAAEIRGEKDKPMFCAYQAYYIYSDEITMCKGERVSPCIVASNSQSAILEKLTETFDEEYKRLCNASIQYTETPKMEQ